MVFTIYTILVQEDHSLITTNRQRVIQRSSLVDDLHILIPPVYEGKNISDATVTVEYVLPISRKWTYETLVKSAELYKGHLEYKLPFDTKLTKEHGDVEIQVTMLLLEMDYEGNVKQWVRKTTPTVIPIIPLAAWSNQIADPEFTAIDQRLIQSEMQINALVDVANTLGNMADEFQYDLSRKGDALSYNKDTNKLSMYAGQTKISEVELEEYTGEGGSGGTDPDGQPVVDFSGSSDSTSDSSSGVERDDEVTIF